MLEESCGSYCSSWCIYSVIFVAEAISTILRRQMLGYGIECIDSRKRCRRNKSSLCTEDALCADSRLHSQLNEMVYQLHSY